jgi:outer membrane protein OmpA-like peptidoglycan-associated protein
MAFCKRNHQGKIITVLKRGIRQLKGMLRPRIKIILIISCLLPAQAIFSQPVTIIKGVVSTEETNQESSPVVNARVVLFAPNGSVKESISDIKGEYFLSVKKGLGKVQLFIEVGKNTISYHLNAGEYIQPTKAVKTIDIAAQDTILYNFTLKNGKPLPEIAFNLNSITPTNDSGLVQLAGILKANAALVIEIEGHCDAGEKAGISKKRALLVKTNLVKRGIVAKRLNIKDLGASQPVIPMDVIMKINSPSQKEILQRRNRRVAFRVL